MIDGHELRRCAEFRRLGAPNKAALGLLHGPTEPLPTASKRSVRPCRSDDEVWGVFAIGALRVGDIEGAAKILSHARFGYSVGILLRLAFVAPGVAMRTARRLVAIRRK